MAATPPNTSSFSQGVRLLLIKCSKSLKAKGQPAFSATPRVYQCQLDVAARIEPGIRGNGRFTFWMTAVSNG
jgi:hypothetical protein